MRKTLDASKAVNLIKKLPKQHRTGLAIASMFLGALILLPSEPAEASRHTEAMALDAGVRYPIAIDLTPSSDVFVGEDESSWHT